MGKENFKILIYVIFIFLIWRATLFFITYAGISIFPHYLHEQKITEPPNQNLNYLLTWAQWDGGQFRGIVENGYLPFQTVFFPGYPILISFLYKLGFSSLIAGLIISNISAILSLFFFYKLILLDYKKEVAKKAIYFLLVFPTSFYLGAVYSEALFLFSCVASFYFFRTNRWILALIFAQIAVITRLVGLALVAALLIEYLSRNNSILNQIPWLNKIGKLLTLFVVLTIIINQIQLLIISNKIWLIAGLLSYLATPLLIGITIILSFYLVSLIFQRINLKHILSFKAFFIALSSWPLFAYVLYQIFQFGKPFSFLENEYLWGRQLTLPWEAPISYLHDLISVGFFQIGGTVYLLIEFIIFMIFLIGLFISYKKLRFSYTIFYGLVFTIPLLSGTLFAYPRYVLIIFPFFILLGTIKNELLEKTITLIFLSTLILFSIMYINHYRVT